MKPQHLRTWIKHGGAAGLLAAAIVLGVRHFWLQKRTRVLLLASLGTLLMLLWPHRSHHAVAPVAIVPSLPSTPAPVAASTAPAEKASPQIYHFLSGDYCADVEEWENDTITRIRVHRVKDGTIVLQRMTDDCLVRNVIAWSPDGRTLAFIEQGYTRRVVIWNIEGTLQVFDSQEINDIFDVAYGIVWSPDSTRFLVLDMTSGGIDARSGTLWCFHIRSGHMHRVSREKWDWVGRYEWVGKRQVRYWKGAQDALEKTPHSWECTLK